MDIVQTVFHETTPVSTVDEMNRTYPCNVPWCTVTPCTWVDELNDGTHFHRSHATGIRNVEVGISDSYTVATDSFAPEEEPSFVFANDEVVSAQSAYATASALIQLADKIVGGGSDE